MKHGKKREESEKRVCRERGSASGRVVGGGGKLREGRVRAYG